MLADRVAQACQGATLDLRPAGVFAAGHLRGSASFPASELASRTAELPPASGPGVRLLHATAAELAEAERVLTQGTSVWSIVDTLLASAELWSAAEALDFVEMGSHSQRLWAPSPNLARAAEIIEMLHPSRSCNAVDLGCGRGRDCVWLSARGWSCIGVDNQRSFLAHLDAFARREGLHERLHGELIDLRRCDGGVLDRLLVYARVACIEARDSHMPAQHRGV